MVGARPAVGRNSLDRERGEKEGALNAGRWPRRAPRTGAFCRKMLEWRARGPRARCGCSARWQGATNSITPQARSSSRRRTARAPSVRPAMARAWPSCASHWGLSTVPARRRARAPPGLAPFHRLRGRQPHPVRIHPVVPHGEDPGAHWNPWAREGGAGCREAKSGVRAGPPRRRPLKRSRKGLSSIVARSRGARPSLESP